VTLHAKYEANHSEIQMRKTLFEFLRLNLLFAHFTFSAIKHKCMFQSSCIHVGPVKAYFCNNFGSIFCASVPVQMCTQSSFIVFVTSCVLCTHDKHVI